MDVLCSEDGMKLEEIMELARDEFITIMLRLHKANSSRRWRLMIKNAKMEKTDLTVSTYVQYVEDFKFWVNVAGITHRLSYREIAKCFVSGLKPTFSVKKCIQGLSRTWMTLFEKPAKS